MSALRPDPDLFDVAAWQQRLDELRAEQPSSLRDAKIEYAEAHIRAIGGIPEKSAPEAA
ncbi:hypothetical protein [Paracoccus kondratievae]|uniref:hypothetical protein n=1 Tax=Paracoccus kondratievae TaxID=135740 RepID=UPI00187A6A5C|nr:hypothetical protein [Paracoccus kondratievae]